MISKNTKITYVLVNILWQVPKWFQNIFSIKHPRSILINLNLYSLELGMICICFLYAKKRTSLVADLHSLDPQSHCGFTLNCISRINSWFASAFSFWKQAFTPRTNFKNANLDMIFQLVIIPGSGLCVCLPCLGRT